MKYASVVIILSSGFVYAQQEYPSFLERVAPPRKNPPPTWVDNSPRTTSVDSFGNIYHQVHKDTGTDVYGANPSTGETWSTQTFNGGTAKGVTPTGQSWYYNPNNFGNPLLKQGE